MNLKSSEFRIGNLLQDANGRLLNVSDLNDGIQGIAFKKVQRKFKIVLPISEIPLTDKFSENFDFENLMEMAAYFCHKSIFPIKITEADLKQLTVHESQNLYKSLTGEELTFNQTKSA